MLHKLLQMWQHLHVTPWEMLLCSFWWHRLTRVCIQETPEVFVKGIKTLVTLCLALAERKYVNVYW